MGGNRVKKLNQARELWPGLFKTLVALAIPGIVGVNLAWAGPPYFTDDPEPVEPGHVEMTIASQFVKDKSGNRSATAPSVGVNYGLVEDLHLHVAAPLAWNQPSDQSTKAGLGDVELAVKYRFVHEGALIPQVAALPTVTLPTGDSDNGLGTGRARLLLPLWLQKSWGDWTSFGGGGYWINPGYQRQNYWIAGWALQRTLSKWLSLGAEIYYTMADTVSASDHYGFYVGAIINLTQEHHILLSAGRDIQGDNDIALFLGYQWTFDLRGLK